MPVEYGATVTETVTMVRTERVMQLVDLLRSREAATIGEIASELRVSRRTVLRDLATLRARGMAVSSDPGPGGGVRLERDRGAASVHFSFDEVIALWLGARLSAATSQLPWGGAARSALDKLFASVPRERARSLRALSRRVVIGNPATERIRAELGQAPPELLSVFERAFSEGVCLAFEYRDRRGERTTRTIEPHGLLVESPAWYLLAWDPERADVRMFRMDRIARPRLVPSRTFVPDLERLRRIREAARSTPPPAG